MLAQMSVLNISAKAMSTNGPHGTVSASNRNQLAQSEQLSSFMEIMGALLNLGETASENVTKNWGFPVNRAKGNAIAEFERLFDMEQSDIAPNELIQMLWTLSNGIDSQSQISLNARTANCLNDFIQDLIGGPFETIASLKNQSTGGWKEKLTEIMQQLQYLAGSVSNIDLPDKKCNADLAQPDQSENCDQKLVTAFFDSQQGVNGKDETNASAKVQEMDSSRLVSKSQSNIKTMGQDLTKYSEESAKDQMQQAAKETNGKIQPFKVSGFPSQVNQTENIQRQPLMALENNNFMKEAQSTMASGQKAEIETTAYVTGDLLDDSDELFKFAEHKNIATTLFHDSEQNRSLVKSDLFSHEMSATKEAQLLNRENQSDIIRQIVQRMTLNTQGNNSQMHIRLKPDFLGDVHLQILTENHQVSVRITADSLAVKEIVEQNLQHLRQELQHHGLEIQKFDVFVNSDNQEGKYSQEQAGFNQAQRQRQRRSDKRQADGKGPMRLATFEDKKQNTQTDSSAISYFV